MPLTREQLAAICWANDVRWDFLIGQNVFIVCADGQKVFAEIGVSDFREVAATVRRWQKMIG